jgi:flavoprotein
VSSKRTNYEKLYFEINFSCKKCHDYFKHEETVALFKQHSYHLQCFLCTDCQKQLSHESFYLDEKLQLNVISIQIEDAHFLLFRYRILKFIVNDAI